MRALKCVVLLSLAAMLAACGGRAQSILPAPDTIVPNVVAADATVPEKKRKPIPVSVDVQVLSAAALSAGTFSGSDAIIASPATRAVALEPSGNVRAYANVAAGVRGCKRNALGLLCSVALSVRKPANGFTLQTFDEPLGKQGRPNGRLLAYGYSKQRLFGTKPIAIHLELNSYVGSVRVVALNSNPPAGCATDLGLKLDIEDRDGFTIPAGSFLPGSIEANVTTFPSTSGNLVFTVNGKKNDIQIAKPTDRYSLRYFGSGIISATIVFAPYASNTVLGKATLAPQMVSLPVAGSPHVDAGSDIVAPIAGTEWFTQSAKSEIGILTGNALAEQTLPSGHAPAHIAFGSYNEPLLTIAFSTQQNTVGTVDSQRDVAESAPFGGSTITGLAYDGWYEAPVFAESTGTIAEYFGNNFIPDVITGTPNLTNLVSEGSGWAFGDPGNKGVGFISGLLPDTPTYNEQAFPPNIGTPSFVALGPAQTVWAGLSGKSAGAILTGAGPTAFRTKAAITSMALIGDQYGTSGAMAATDTNGDIELFDPKGKLLATYHPADGPASGIVAGPAQDLFYVCATCAKGIHRFFY